MSRSLQIQKSDVGRKVRRTVLVSNPRDLNQTAMAHALLSKRRGCLNALQIAIALFLPP